MSGLKDFVFERAQELQALEKHLRSAPLLVNVVARAFDWRFESAGISTESFSEFSDKEYFHQVQTKTAELIQGSQDGLTPDQANRADACLDAVTQMPLLDQAITAKSALEQLQATQAEWEILDRQVRKSNTRRQLGWIGLIAAISALCFLFQLGVLDDLKGIKQGTVQATRLSQMCCTAIGLLPFGVIVASAGLIISGSKAPRAQHEQLSRDRTVWRSCLLPNETWEQVVALFGDQSSEGFQNIRTDREELLKGVLEQDQGVDWVASINRPLSR